MHLAFAICTLKRPVMLRNCLESLRALEKPEQVRVSVIVVENDGAGESRAIVEDVLAKSALDFVFATEPDQGIPIARNRSVELALKTDADWIAFIDDDEELPADWLTKMARHAASGRADVYTGPVVWVYPPDVPDWILAMRSSPNYADGEILNFAPTNNTIAARSVFESRNGNSKFDETMRFTGGSDKEFFMRAVADGLVIRNVQDVPIYETVPDGRLTLRWNLERRRRAFAIRATIMRKHEGAKKAWSRGLPVVLRNAYRAFFALLIAGFRMLYDRPAARKKGARALSSLSECAGMLAGLIGRSPQPYKRIEGG